MTEPMLHIAAVWLDGDRAPAVAAALRELGDPPTGYDRGQVVSFRREVADNLGFRRLMAQLDLAEANSRPPRQP